MVEHTTLPWAAYEDARGTNPDILICNTTGSIVAEIGGGLLETRRANASLIVRAVNSHAALVAALKRLLDSTPYVSDAESCECGEDGEGDGGTCEHVQAHRALAQARGD